MMQRLWLLFAQAVTAGVVVFVLTAVVAPESLPWRGRTVIIGQSEVNSGRSEAVSTGELRAVAPGYSAAAARALPSVVAVYVAKAPPRGARGYPGQFGDPDEDEAEGSGLGSGVVMSADGYILTNSHVVADADAIAVGLPNGQQARAKVIGTDPETDLAVVKIDAQGLAPIALGDSDALRIGDIVLAIGNPFGVGQTVTQGIVSATGRNRVGINTFENFIQTDAAINPGNSGGALVDASGKLVGINTAILSPSGGSLGIGFAIPMRLASQVMADLIKDGRVARGWVGVEAQDLTPEIARVLGVSAQRGSVVSRVLRGGPAHRAGLKRGDVVVAIDGKPVTDTVEFVNLTAGIKPGGRGEFAVLRKNNEMKLPIEVGSRPPMRRSQ
ncbi:MAG TPA: trypsin-like peptidase domain-containing protein [Burkholderiaceae bacterium]|nr:trypsin-like peptidase domain-containing protein [Burkholderiaceae bacterium]